jgi:hypothetical protein
LPFRPKPTEGKFIVFWLDATLLSQQDWWTEPAWDGGPGYGELVEAVRPALRAALLLGWRVHSIDLGIGRSSGQSTDWASIELATLELVAATPLDVDKPFDGPNLHLGVAEIVDLHGRLGDDGDYAIPIDIPVFGAGELTDGVPAGIADGVDAFVNDALDELAPTVPDDPVLAAPRSNQQGLLWLLYTNHWRGLTEEAKFEAGAQTIALRQDPTGFLMGELYGQSVAKPAAELWDHLALSVQARGEAHRLPQQARGRLPSMSWLDALSELVWRGAVIVDGLVEPADPPPPIEALRFGAAEDDPVTELTLSIWGGDAEVTLRRWLTFDDEGHDTLTGSVAWDYVPGDDQQRPMVVVVAGRGVQIEPDPEVTLTGRSVPPGSDEDDEEGPDTARVADGAGAAVRPGGLPWDLLIHRVQDDALVPAAGAKIDPVVLLGPSVIDPDPPLEHTGQDTTLNPQPALLVVPKHDGVLLQFPARGTATPGNTPVESVDIPRVIELTIPDPTSGTSAWTADVHFYTYDPTAITVGGAHLCVWTTPDIQIHTNDSPHGCDRGDPSSVAEAHWFTAWQYSAELFEADPPSRLRRPFSAVLPFTESAAQRPDRLQGVPRLDYDGHAVHDGLALIPALHCFRQFGYIDSLAFDVMDVLISFVPFVGDAADIGEAIWAWQTGTDKWGRPVSRFGLALMIGGAAIPIIGAGVLRQLSGLLAKPLSELPAEDLGRLADPARWSGEWPLDQVAATRAIRELSVPEGALVSPGNKAKAEQLLRALAADDSTIRALATRLSSSRIEGWPTVGDVLSQDGTGFSAPVLQTAYLRFLRDHAGSAETPFQYVARLQGGGP